MAAALVAVLVLLVPVRAYFQPGLPVQVRLQTDALEQLPPLRPGETGAFTIALLSPDNQVQATAQVDPQAETIDLAALFPQPDPPGGAAAWLWDGQSHYVQLLRDQTPVGAPLVVIPLRPPNMPPGGPVDPNALRVQVAKDAVLRTTHGDMTLAFSPDAAPNTVLHFQRLVEDGFYTNIKFHRIVPGFVIQGGDPTGTGMGGPGYLLDLEPSSKRHERGTLSMARQGHDPNTAGSQFFICLSRERCAALDGQYTAFGDVATGLEVVDKMAQTPLIDPGLGQPETPPVILRAELTPAPPRPVKGGEPDRALGTVTQPAAQ